MSDVKLSSLHPDPRNARRHSERNLGMIVDSLKEVGAARSIVIDEEGVILAGNATVEAAAEAGIERVQVVDADGSTIVAVRRSGLSPEAKRRLALYDNRAAELADWDSEILAAFAMEDTAVFDGLFDGDELAELVAGFETPEVGSAGVHVFSDEQIIDAAFAYFRKRGFPYRDLPLHVCMQEVNKLATTEPDKLLRTDTAYHVADTYHPHRFHASAEGMKSPFDGFNDDALLRRAMRLALENGYTLPDGVWGQLWIVSGVQPCANFRPGFAAHLYRKHARTGSTVLDTSTGYGGRLVGFMASGIAGKYVGIDPNTTTHEGNVRMAQDLGFSDKVELYNLPAEDVPHSAVEGRCDFAFTSPPYFSKEHYSDDDTQSWVRYKTADAWRDGFLLPMMALQFAALKSGSYAIVNIADVKLRGKTHSLQQWMVDVGKAVGFDYIRTDTYELTRRFGAGMDDEVAVEPVVVFQKPNA